MLIREADIFDSGVVIVMSDAAILTASTKTTILEIARQAAALGHGLQNAAPGQKSGGQNNSVQYLLNVSEHLTKIAEDCGKLTSPA